MEYAAITETAKEIGAKTIAEMVESDEVIAVLKNMGVDFAQGFAISRPQPLPGKTGGVHAAGQGDEMRPLLACA